MPKQSLAPIVGKAIALRLLEESDLPLTLRWRNKERVRSNLKTSRPLSLDEHRSWYHSYAQKEGDFLFVVLERDRMNRPVGQVSLYGIDRAAGTAEFGRLVIGEDDALGKGYAREACVLAIEFAFGSLGLGELELEVFAENSRAVAIYVSLGFVFHVRQDNLLRMKLRKQGPKGMGVS